MLDKTIKYVDQLERAELRTLYNHIRAMLGPTVVYQQKSVRCGCKRCKQGGEGHGLYWYGYFTYEGKTHCVYIGKERREIDPLKELEKKRAKRKPGRRDK